MILYLDSLPNKTRFYIGVLFVG